jgi:hypothetical protein
MSYGHLRGSSKFITIVVVCYIINKLLCSGGLIRKIRLSLFLLGYEVISVGVVIGLVPFA